MVQQVRILAVLVEDQSLAPGTHGLPLRPTCKLMPGKLQQSTSTTGCGGKV